VKTSIAFLSAAYLLAAPSASPERVEKTAEIKNASWQAVPDTVSPDEGFNEPAFININGILRKGDLVIFDVVNPDSSYGRVEGNCQTHQFRSLRFGIFVSSTQVSYTEQNNEAWLDASPYQKKLLILACNTPSK
jgi:hypothetical protein